VNETKLTNEKRIITQPELTKERGNIIERFIAVEGRIDWIILFHYFRGINDSFLFDVLGDEHCSIRLKINILKKITDIKPKEFELFDKLNKIRNYFSHSGGFLYQPHGKDFFYYPSPKKGHPPLDFEELKKEFNKTFAVVVKILNRETEKRGWRVDEEGQIKKK
jgi:hypothetical protein